MFSDRQQISFTGQHILPECRNRNLSAVRKKLLTVRKKILTVRKNLLTGIHMIIAPAYASYCVTTTQNGNYVRLLGVTCFRLIHDSLCMAGPSSTKYKVHTDDRSIVQCTDMRQYQ